MSNYKILQDISGAFQNELNLAQSNLKKAKKSESLNFSGFIESNETVFNFYEKTYEFYIKSLFYEDIEDEKEVLEEAITWLTEAYKDLVKFNRFCSEARDAGDLQENKLQRLIKEALQKKKRDRCLRIADRKYDKPSAYKSGAVVRCRNGEIWKDLKETSLSLLTSIEPYNDLDDEYAQDLDTYLEDDNIDWEKESYITLLNPNNIEPSEWNYLSDDPTNSKSVKISKEDPKKFPPILVVKRGNNKYEAIDGIHRVYAFRLNNHNIPAIVISPKLKQGLSTSDNQMVNFMYNKYKNSDIPTPTIINQLDEDESLHKWFKRSGPKGKEGGWVDCNAPDGKGGYKPCGRKKGEKRAKYPSCRPTPAKCKSPGKGKKWGKTK